MLYDCISLSYAAFSHENKIPRNNASAEISGFAHELSLARSYFRFPIVDIGIHKTEFDLDTVLSLIGHLNGVGYVSRIVTDGSHFSERAGSVLQVRDLLKAGATRIVLRLSDELATQLPADVLTNYVEACASNGLGCELRFDFECTLPESFFEVIRKLESLRFYLKVYPAKVRRVQRVRFNGYINPSSTLNPRIAISNCGEVLIRHQSGDDMLETVLGDLFTGIPLSQCIKPDRLYTKLGAC